MTSSSSTRRPAGCAASCWVSTPDTSRAASPAGTSTTSRARPTAPWACAPSTSSLTELGSMPAWVVPAGTASHRWAVLVHGRGARREEAFARSSRCTTAGSTSWSLPTATTSARDADPTGDTTSASRSGATSRTPCSGGPSGRSGLLLVGWSMGGAIVLQTLARSWVRDLVSQVVLDAPVIDWGTCCPPRPAQRVPLPIGGLSRSLMGRRSAPAGRRARRPRRRPDRLGRPRRRAEAPDPADPLGRRRVRSRGPSQGFAQARPDLVTMEYWDSARHSKEWNVDPDRWDRSVAEFVAD